MPDYDRPELHILARLIEALESIHAQEVNQNNMPRRTYPHMRIYPIVPPGMTTVIHSHDAHNALYKGRVDIDTALVRWIDSVMGIFKLNGLNYIEGSNYFYNERCGVYINVDTQAVIYHEDGNIWDYDTCTSNIYHLIGFLAYNKLIGDVVLATNLPNAKEGGASDKYEF